MIKTPHVVRLPRLPDLGGGGQIKECRIEACGLAARPFSTLCRLHYERRVRTGDPDGFMPESRHVKPHRQLVEDMLAHGFGDLELVQRCESWLMNMVYNPHPGTPKRLMHQYTRLRNGGATGRAMLVRLLALYSLRWHGEPRYMHRSEVVFQCTLGSHLLRTVPSSNKRPEWASGSRTEAWRPTQALRIGMGEAVNEKIGFALVQIVNAMQSALVERMRLETALRDAVAYAKAHGLPIPPAAIMPNLPRKEREKRPPTWDERVQARMPKRKAGRPTKVARKKYEALRLKVEAQLRAEDTAKQDGAAAAEARRIEAQAPKTMKEQAVREAAVREADDFDASMPDLMRQLQRDREART